MTVGAPVIAIEAVAETSIARTVGNMLGKNFRALNATRAGVSDIRKLADEARMVPLLIFVDEVQRFSATQTDDLLAICEKGTADFIGATTGNPLPRPYPCSRLSFNNSETGASEH